MTTEKALEASRLLNDIDAFGLLSVKVDEAFTEVSDIYDISSKKELYTKIMTMFDCLVDRKKKALEEL